MENMLKKIQENILKFEFNNIIGNDEVKKQVKSAIYAKRPIIIVGPPGIGKTTLAKELIKILPIKKVNDCNYNCSPDNPACPSCIMKKKNNEEIKTKDINPEDLFIRVQGSPDLTSEDLIGDIDPVLAMEHGALAIEAFTPGKIFKANNGILFFDEINRCSEKLQNALLQVLEEKKVTVGSYVFDFNVNMIFIATMNPEDSSTEPLSDVFADRFDMIYMDYPENEKDEIQILDSKQIDYAEFPQYLKEFIVNYVQGLRNSKDLEKKPGVRATLGLYERAQTNALINSRNKVTIKDIQDVYVSVLAHRIKLKPSVAYSKTNKEFLRETFDVLAEDYEKQST
jgi:Mg-chelatase subunit ChlI